MSNLWDIPVSSVVSLTPERSVTVIRMILEAECHYAKLGPLALTISDKLMTPDGGIDAEVNTSDSKIIPEDCIFSFGITGFQIKSGTSFTPWTATAIKSELLNSKGELSSELARLVQRNGYYSLICTGHDLTPKQRNDSKALILKNLEDKGIQGYEDKIDVVGASQIKEFAERYPRTAALLTIDPIQEAWTFDEWKQDAHMANIFEESAEQEKIIADIRASLKTDIKHLRVLGEAGLGKTRVVLEALKEEPLSSCTLYIQHGAQFGQTQLFRQLLRFGHDKPLILVIDELPENQLSDIWRHLKPRCGQLKIISMDHGVDNTHDEEIERINVPYLPDEVIKKILVTKVGESSDLDRWVYICEGSPRVAQAVADNLCANPSDLLKPPSTIPIWERFLLGYGDRDDVGVRQVECVTRHLALFSRFGYESPVGDEAKYIAKLINKVDPTIGWARFQEIVQNLRARRVLQGSRTLFFVPKALHIYLWKQFWKSYGHGFDFKETFNSMPESLHVWFMNMFKYAGNDNSHVIDDILNPEGIFSQKEVLTSSKGAQFLSVLAEAKPSVVLRLIEVTIGKWTDEEILALKENRQQFVWTLEKVAVWTPYTLRAIRLLTRLAINENAENSNNATGTLLGLFKIGPEIAATEATPEIKLSALIELLRSHNDVERRLGLDVAKAALDSIGGGYRIIGPEYQGLKEKAKLWKPATYNDWWQSYFIYFQALVKETKNWPPHFRPEVCSYLLDAVEQQIRIPKCTQLALQVLDELVDDEAMLPKKMNRFFSDWRMNFIDEEDDCDGHKVKKKIQSIERRYTRRSIVSRFHRYVLDVDWMEWDEDYRQSTDKPQSHAKALTRALARKIATSPENINKIYHLLEPDEHTPALGYFGEHLAKNDPERVLLSTLIKSTLETKHETCLIGYLSEVKQRDYKFYVSTANSFFDTEKSAWLATQITLSGDYGDESFLKCLDVFEKGWILPRHFQPLRYGKLIDKVPDNRIKVLYEQLLIHNSEDATHILIELLDSVTLSELYPFDYELVFKALVKATPREDGRYVRRGYHWKRLGEKLIKKDESYVLPLLDSLLHSMGNNYALSYDHYVQPFANDLVALNPSGAWGIVKRHFEQTLPKWRGDLFSWLKGGLARFNQKKPTGAIADLPFSEIMEWIEQDSNSRAGLIAHAVLPTLDDVNGGQLTRELIYKYSHVSGVISGISSAFHSYSITGLTSVYLKKEREKFRQWLASGFELEVIQWIETEIERLDRRIEEEETNEERSRFD